MNQHKRLLHWFVYSGIFIVLWGCLEYDITTQVMPDGRILRTVTVKGDSADIFTGSFRVPADSSWAIVTRLESRSDKDINEGKVYVYEARKEFGNVSELNHTFYTDSSFNDHISIEVKFDKKFNWFYTNYQYTETYSRLFPFRSEAVSDYLSPAELRIHLANDKEIFYSPTEDSILFITDSLNLPRLSKTDSLRFTVLRDSIEHKFETWQKVNIFNDFYSQTLVALKKLERDIDTAAIRAPFFHWLDSVKTVETGIENSDAFTEAAAIFFKINPETLKAANPDGFDTFFRKFRVAAFSLETYTSRVLMPGMIISSNAGKVDVNMASWTFKIDNFYATDFEMTVESRIVNRWFIVIVGVVLIVFIGLGLAGIFKK